MTLRTEIGQGVLKELQNTLDWLKSQVLDEERLGDFTKAILLHRSQIFLVGKGRSGLVAQAFAMRLAQIGSKARFLGEPTVPPVEKGDLFIVVSGSGTNLVEETKIAKEVGAKIIVVTSYKDSALAVLADLLLIIPGREKEDSEVPYYERKLKGRPALALGTAFEILAMVTFDSVIGTIVEEQKMSEKDLQKRHARPQF